MPAFTGQPTSNEGEVVGDLCNGFANQLQCEVTLLCILKDSRVAWASFLEEQQRHSLRSSAANELGRRSIDTLC